jgi:hypothetical protein
MLKWQERGREESFIRMPKPLLFLLVLLYAAAFLLVVMGWAKWAGLVLRHNQTLLSLVR